MTDRERFLAIVTFSIVGFGAVVLLANKLIFAPAKEAKMEIQSVGLRVEDLRVKVGLERSYHQKYDDYVARSFGTDRDQASANSREFVMQMLSRSGLKSEEVRTTPITGTRLKNQAGSELGWNVTVVGSLVKITNLLYLLQNDRHLLRIEDVSWSPIAKNTDVTLQFKLMTLVLEPQQPGKDRLPSLAAQVEDFAWFLKANATSQQLASNKELRSDERKQYAMIAERDIFRPYIKRPPAPKRVDPPPRTTERNDPPAAPRPPSIRYALVGLPQFGSTPEVMVRDSKSGKVRTFKIGEDLMGGEIVMIDYRGLPLLKDPERYSSSRVIIRVGRELWAVELGDDLSNRYRMPNDRLPDSLRQAPAIVQPKSDPPKEDTTSSNVPTPPDSKLTKISTPSNDATTSKEFDDAP